MTVANAAASAHPARLEPPRRDLKQSMLYYLGWAGLLAALVLSWEGADMRPGALLEYWPNMVRFADGFFPPDFTNWQDYVSEMVVTVQIAVWGTVLAVGLSIPSAFCVRRIWRPGTLPSPCDGWMDAFRAINEMVFAMLFVVAVGLGPFAGVLALFIHTTGILAKLFSEAVEAVDPRPVEGIRANGASWLQEVVFGVIPQVIPLWISYSLYRFESNVRSATVLGIVGAGGIGQVLWEYIRGFYYAETAAVMIIIILSVSILDILSQRLRKLFI